MKLSYALPICCALVLPIFQAQAAEPNVVPGKSLGRIFLGFTGSQVHKALGKPDKTLKLKSGLVDDVYISKKVRKNSDGSAIRDKVEVLYKAGKVIQIEATSPIFKTASGLSTQTKLPVLDRTLNPKRYYTYATPGDDVSGALMYYLDQVQAGIAFEYGPAQDTWYEGFGSNTIIVHRKGIPVLADQGLEFVSAEASVPYD